MKKTGKILITGSFFLLSFSASSQNVFDGVLVPPRPAAWNTHGGQYQLAIDNTIKHSGNSSASLKYTGPKSDDFGTLVQSCEADPFIGKRVRMTAYVKAEKVKGWAGLWFRLDEKGTSRMLGFDNMNTNEDRRPITKTKDWQAYSIVLDVPVGTYRLVYGALLVGKGEIWVDDMVFEIVDSSVKTTGKDAGQLLQDKGMASDDPPGYPTPTNLGFEN